MDASSFSALSNPAPAALSSPVPAVPSPTPAALPTPSLHDIPRLNSKMVQLERLGSSLQLEMLEIDKVGHEILKGLENHIGFLLLYSLCGLILQVSDKVDCWSGLMIMVVVTLIFIVGILLAVQMTQMKLESLRGAVKELNKRKSALIEQAKEIENTYKQLEAAIERQYNTAIVRTESLIGRVALSDSKDMSSFSDINEKMMSYILACGLVYLIVLGFLFLVRNCGGWSCPASYFTEACVMVLILTGTYFLKVDTCWTRGCFMVASGVLLFVVGGGLIITHCVGGGGDGGRLFWK